MKITVVPVDEEDHDCEEISETEEVVEDNLLEDYNQFGN